MRRLKRAVVSNRAGIRHVNKFKKLIKTNHLNGNSNKAAVQASNNTIIWFVACITAHKSKVEQVDSKLNMVIQTSTDKRAWQGDPNFII